MGHIHGLGANPLGSRSAPARGARPSGGGDDRPAPVDAGGLLPAASEEGIIEHSPAVHVRRPRLDYESPDIGLDRNELGAFLVAAGLSSARDHALCSLLAPNGLRIWPLARTSTDSVSNEVTAPSSCIARRQDSDDPAGIAHARAVDLAVGERFDEPIFLGHSFITVALHAGVPLRDVQEAASHADPRTTMR